MYENRTYRNFSITGTTPFQVTVDQSDLFIRADKQLKEPALVALKQARRQLERYIYDNPLFERSLLPMRSEFTAPKIVRLMLDAGIAAGVGPMAAVAGALAQIVGQAVLEHSDRVFVENGGDLYLALKEKLQIGIVAGKSPLSGRIGLVIRPEDTPCGLCTSSGTIGHSFSEGKADTVTVLAPDAALADAVATATCNKVQSAKDVQAAVEFAAQIEGVQGACVIYKDKLAVQGNLELIPMENDL
jgi:hypothetical protein